MANNFDAFVKKCQQAPRMIMDARVDSVKASALVVTTSVRNEIHRVAPSGRMKGVGKAGAKIGAGFTLKTGQNPTAIVAARGPLHLLERDTEAHTIRPKSRRGPKAAIRIPNADPTMMFRRTPVSHPGTRGKHPFEKGVRKGEKLVPGVASRSLHQSMAKVFKGG